MFASLEFGSRIIGSNNCRTEFNRGNSISPSMPLEEEKEAVPAAAIVADDDDAPPLPLRVRAALLDIECVERNRLRFMSVGVSAMESNRGCKKWSARSNNELNDDNDDDETPPDIDDDDDVGEVVEI